MELETETETKKTQEEQHKLYIKMSKTNIDNFIYNNDYKNSFALLIMVLERLDNDEKVEFIDYYSKKLHDVIRGYIPFRL